MTDIPYIDKRSAKGKLTQQGGHNLIHFAMRVPNVRLRLNEKLVRQDLTIKSAISTYGHHIVSTIGEITHPDEEIAQFLNNNLKRLEDSLGVSWKTCLKTAQFTKDWAGASVSEIMYDLKFGTLMLSDIVTYHPSTIALYTNKKGRLVDDEETWDGYHKSGIWQLALGSNVSEKKLDLWKCLFLSNDSDYGNYYGQSLVAPCYKWQRLKDAIIDLMMIYLEKAGHRLTWVRSPSFPTNETRVSFVTGEEETITTMDVLKEQIESDDAIKQLLLLPQMTADIAPEVGSVPMSDLVGNLFLDAIAYADEQSVRHICPYFLISDRSFKISPEAVEQRMETFNEIKEDQRQQMTSAMVHQCLTLLVKWNFNRASANIPPDFSRVYSDRAEARVATMQTIKGLTEDGYLNPRNQADWSMVRQMVKLADRAMDADDLEFIQEVVINPRQKPMGAEGGANGAGKRGRRTGSTTKQVNARKAA